MNRLLAEDGWQVHLLDLKECYSASSLDGAFDNIPDAGIMGEGRSVLLLDSVDETPGLVRHYLKFLEERLSPLNKGGWRVIAVCRTAESVIALDHLFEDLQEGAVHVLLPLRRSDVVAIAEAQGLEAPAFVEAITRRRLDSLAAIPFTLTLLCRIYGSDSAFPDSRASVFERAIALILAEDQVAGYMPAPNEALAGPVTAGSGPLRRRVAMERLAAFGAFAETGGLALSTMGQASAGTLTERLVGDEMYEAQRFELNNDDLLSLLRTPLFANSGPNERQFAHRRLRDFLAARFLVRQHLDRSQLISILTVADSGTIPPQMVDVATWLVALDPAEFDSLIDSDPLSLVRNRICDDLPSFAARLVAELLSRPEEADRTLSWRDDLSGLEHAELAAQLRPIHAMTEAQQAVALRILRGSYVPGLEVELQDLIGNSRTPIRIRELAVDALEAHPEVLEKLDIAAPGFFDGDTNAQLRGDLLRALWPTRLTTSELLPLLVKQPKNFLGSYSIFLSNLEKSLESDVAKAIVHWRANRSIEQTDESDLRRTTRRGLRSLVDAAVRVVLELPDLDPDLISAVAEVLASRLSKDRDRLPFVRARISVEILRAAIVGIVRNRAHDRLAWYRLWSAADADGVRLLGRADVDWMADQAEAAEDDAVFAIWLELIDRFLDPVIERDLAWVWARRSGRLGPGLQYRFIPIELDSEQARNARQSWVMVHPADDEPSEKAMPVDEYLGELRRIMTLTRTEPERFFSLVRWLDVDLAIRRYGHDNAPDVLELVNIKLLERAEIEELLELASEYLIVCTDSFPKRLRRDTMYLHLRAAYRALYTLQKHLPDRLDRIGNEAWGKLSVAILEYPVSLSDIGGRSDRRELLRRAFERAPQSTKSAIRALLSRHSKGFGESSSLPDLDTYLDDSDIPLLQSALRAGTYNRDAIVELYVRLNKLNAMQWMRRRSLTSTSVSEVALLLGAQMEKDPSTGFEVLDEFIESGSDIRQEVLLEVAARERHGQRRIHEVTPNARIKAFELLSVIFPASEESFETGMHAITPREDIAEWRQGLLSSVVNGGTREGLRSLVELAQRRPDLELGWALAAAREAYRVNGWSALSIGELRTVLERSGARLARSNSDVISIVARALDEIQGWLIGETPQAFALWDMGPDGRQVPKDENRISDWYCHALRVFLRTTNLVINREVEVKKVSGSGVGNRQDIRVEVRDSETGDHFVTVIEVKGIWNTGVKTNLVTQLARDYLEGGNLTHGIYLVVAFAPAQITSEPKSRVVARNLRNLRPVLEHQAATEAPTLTIIPIIHEADLPV